MTPQHGILGIEVEFWRYFQIVKDMYVELSEDKKQHSCETSQVSYAF